MKDVLIVCKAVEPEMLKAIEETGAEPEILWMEAGLHDVPQKLNATLREKLREAERTYRPDRVLLGYGFCGNALRGIEAGEYTLILPRVDDCITMFIGSREKKRELEGGVGTFFMTEGWLNNDVSILKQREQFIEDYGEEDGLDVFQMMYGHYRRIGLLDCHCGHIDELKRRSCALAEAIGFEHCVFDASIDYVKQLLTGPWPTDKFIVKAPHEMITEQDLRV